MYIFLKNYYIDSKVINLFRLFKAIVIGLSFVFPGLCSATTAILLNEYDNLLETIGNFYNFKILKKHLILLVGILIGMLMGIIMFKILFEKNILIILTVFLTVNLKLYKIKKDNSKSLFYTIIGFLIVYAFTNILVSIDNDFFILYIAYGLIVALGFVLPGLSGSLMMLNLGLYELIFHLLNTRNFLNSVLILFITGLLIGIVIWSKVFGKLIKEGNLIFLSIIDGMVVGSVFLLLKEVLKCIKNFNEIILCILIMLFTLLFFKIYEKYLRKKR